MGYVMVPVPEEHVEEAMQMILRITAKARVTEMADKLLANPVIESYRVEVLQ